MLFIQNYWSSKGFTKDGTISDQIRRTYTLSRKSENAFRAKEEIAATVGVARGGRQNELIAWSPDINFVSQSCWVERKLRGIQDH